MILGNCIPIPFGKRSDAYQWDIINNFIADVIADGGTFEDAACMYQEIQHLLGQAYGGSNAYDEATLVLTANAWKANIMYAVKRGVGLSDFPFTRALSAYRVNSDGDLELMGNNVPRLTYDTSYNGCPAWLFEPARTNLFTYSQDFDNAIWSKAGSGSATSPVVTANYGLAPDGTLTADRVQFSVTGSTSGDRSILRQLQNVPAINHSKSFWVKLTSGSTPVTMAFVFISGAVNTFVVTDEWQKFTYTAVGLATPFFYGIETNGTTTKVADVLVWGAQLEAGNYATSYIPTAGATVTRPADVSTRTDLQTGGYLGATSGAFYIDYENTSQAAAGSSAEIEVKKGILDGFQMQATLSGSVYCLSFRKLVGGVGTTIFTPSYSPANYRALVVYTATTISVYINGTKVVNDSAFTRTNDDFDTFNILGGGLYRKAIRTLAFSDVVPTEAQALAVCGFTNLDEYLGFINYTSDNPALYESYT